MICLFRTVVGPLLPEQKRHVRHVIANIDRAHAPLDLPPIGLLLINQRHQAVLHLSTALPDRARVRLRGRTRMYRCIGPECLRQECCRTLQRGLLLWRRRWGWPTTNWHGIQNGPNFRSLLLLMNPAVQLAGGTAIGAGTTHIARIAANLAPVAMDTCGALNLESVRMDRQLHGASIEVSNLIAFSSPCCLAATNYPVQPRPWRRAESENTIEVDPIRNPFIALAFNSYNPSKLAMRRYQSSSQTE